MAGSWSTSASGSTQRTPADWRCVDLDESVGRLPQEAWLNERAPNRRVVLRANRQETLIEAVRRGIGLGVLPCFAADDDADLVRLLGPEEVLTPTVAIHIAVMARPDFAEVFTLVAMILDGPWGPGAVPRVERGLGVWEDMYTAGASEVQGREAVAAWIAEENETITAAGEAVDEEAER